MLGLREKSSAKWRPREQSTRLDPRDAGRFSALRSSAEILAGAANAYHAAHTRSVSAAGSRLLQAKLSRNSNQIATDGFAGSSPTCPARQCGLSTHPWQSRRVGDGLLSAAIQSPDRGKTGGARGRRAGLTLKSAGLRSTNMPTTLHIEALNEPLIEVQPQPPTPGAVPLSVMAATLRPISLEVSYGK
jgi:hypothetical protein